MSSQFRPLPAGFIEPCRPTSSPTPPSGEEWAHEIMHDGFRVIARKEDKQVKLYGRMGNDLTERFPLIVEAMSHCESGPASSPIRLKQQAGPFSTANSASGSLVTLTSRMILPVSSTMQ